MVAAGGSGAAYNCEGAPGGNLKGFYPYENNNFALADDVDQTKGDENGIGGNGISASTISGSGGGGGWRGGPSSGDYAIAEDNSYKAVARSGSSYISGYGGCTENSKIKFRVPRK